MKIIIIGATGTIGKHVTKLLEKDHEVIIFNVGSTSGDFQVDIKSTTSIKKLFESTGKFDALVSVTGDVHFGPLNSMTDADFRRNR